jgi:hypothetical protein
MGQSHHIPTDEDWGEYWLDLDTAYAYRQFAGKTIADVQVFFDSPLIVSESIGSMPKIPFQFYVFAFDTFLRSETLMTNFKTSLDGPDCSSTFLRLVLSKLESQPDDIVPIMNLLMPLCEFVADHQSYFGAKEDIYGSYPDLLREIQSIVDRASDSVQQ